MSTSSAGGARQPSRLQIARELSPLLAAIVLVGASFGTVAATAYTRAQPNAAVAPRAFAVAAVLLFVSWIGGTVVGALGGNLIVARHRRVLTGRPRSRFEHDRAAT